MQAWRAKLKGVFDDERWVGASEAARATTTKRFSLSRAFSRSRDCRDERQLWSKIKVILHLCNRWSWVNPILTRPTWKSTFQLLVVRRRPLPAAQSVSQSPFTTDAHEHDSSLALPAKPTPPTNLPGPNTDRHQTTTLRSLRLLLCVTMPVKKSRKQSSCLRWLGPEI